MKSDNISHAVILAGGKGSRLRPLTYKVPKVMIEIENKPFLQYLLERLRKKGISNILLLVSYLGKQIQDYFGNGRKFGLKISYSFEDHPRGTGGALKKAERLIAPEFLLLNGDTYLDCDLKRLKNTFKTLAPKGLICAYVNKDKELASNLLLAKDNRIIRYDKNNSKGLNAVDAGIGIFKKEVLGLIPKNRNVSFENQIYKRMIRKKELYAFPIKDKFIDIGDFKQLKYAMRVMR